jgi:hypothetical protein
MERRRGPTPNGGVESVAFFLDDEDKPIEKAQATRMRILELNDAGEAIFSTYGFLNRTKQSKPRPRLPK